jgi:DNA-binding MarR family transcriptional regulator
MSSGTPEPEREDRVDALLAELARIGTLSVLFSQAVAEHAGINSTDLESLDILRRDGPLTAGRLAELTGLSTGGAITALIDRLERLGYARREADPHDRRRVLVHGVTEQVERELGPLYAPLHRATLDLTAGYSDEELAVVHDFITHANGLMLEQIARVRGSTGDDLAGAARLRRGNESSSQET